MEEANDSVLLIAATYYDLLGCQQTEEMQALAVWYMTLNPDVLSQDVNSGGGTGKRTDNKAQPKTPEAAIGETYPAYGPSSG